MHDVAADAPVRAALQHRGTSEEQLERIPRPLACPCGRPVPKVDACEDDGKLLVHRLVFVETVPEARQELWIGGEFRGYVVAWAVPLAENGEQPIAVEEPDRRDGRRPPC